MTLLIVVLLPVVLELILNSNAPTAPSRIGP